MVGSRPTAVDLGAGNLRNTEFARSLGWCVLPLDAAGDHGSLRIDLGKDRLPCDDGSVDLFLCNYTLCFLDEKQRAHLVSEVRRAAKGGAHIFVEMYKAKNSFPYDTREISNRLGWKIVRMSKDRFVARRQSYLDYHM
jgi:hypothetical protein